MVVGGNGMRKRRGEDDLECLSEINQGFRKLALPSIHLQLSSFALCATQPGTCRLRVIVSLFSMHGSGASLNYG